MEKELDGLIRVVEPRDKGHMTWVLRIEFHFEDWGNKKTQKIEKNNRNLEKHRKKIEKETEKRKKKYYFVPPATPTNRLRCCVSGGEAKRRSCDSFSPCSSRTSRNSNPLNLPFTLHTASSQKPPFCTQLRIQLRPIPK
jgi:hypothetical protein